MTVVDREEGATEAFSAEGVALHALYRKSAFTAETLKVYSVASKYRRFAAGEARNLLAPIVE